MRGDDILNSLPENPSPAREHQILDHVRAGNYVINWLPITIESGPRRATFWVSNDAIRLGDKESSFRPGMTQLTQQKIADELNAVLPTAKLSDEIYRQADLKIKPNLVFGGPKMAKMSTMKAYNASVDARIQNIITEIYAGTVLPEEFLIASVGKDWVNSRRLLGNPIVQGAPASINYGGHREDMGPIPKTGPFRSASLYPPVVVHQSEGRAHNIGHTDYSQVGRFVAREVMVCEPMGAVSGFGAAAPMYTQCFQGIDCLLPNGAQGTSICYDIYDIAQDDERWGLVSHNGPVHMRHFAVKYRSPTGAGQGLWPGVTNPPPPNTVDPNAPVIPTHPHPPTPPTPPPLAVAQAGMSPKVLAVVAGLGLGWYAMNQLR